MNIPKNAIELINHQDIDLDQPIDQTISRDLQDSVATCRTSVSQASHSSGTIT
jgi:hypothetical protein